jgi:RNA polymerase sigma-70 factor, ECF subfamily
MWCELFLGSMREGARRSFVTSPKLERILDGIVRRACTVYPGVRLSPERFVTHLGLLAGPELADAEALQSLRADELYLTCACAEGDPQALERLERDFLDETAAALERSSRSGLSVDEIMQALRVRLLLAHDGRPPRIGQFSGRGALGGWLRIAATRAMLDEIKRAPLGTDVVGHRLDALEDCASSETPELAHLRGEHGAMFKTAFQGALTQLSPRERNLLRHQVIHQLTGDQIASLYRVHRITVMKWLNRVRAKLTELTREEIAARLQLTASQLDSLMRAVSVGIDVSLRRVLGSAREKEAAR